MALSPETGTGRATRARLGLLVGLTVALALAVTLLVHWLGERPGLRLRADWRARRDLNSYAASTLAVVFSENVRDAAERIREETRHAKPRWRAGVLRCDNVAALAAKTRALSLNRTRFFFAFQPRVRTPIT